MQSLHLQIEILQNRLHDLTQRSEFYYDVIIELLRVLDTQAEMVEDALWQMLYYRDLLNDVNAEIVQLEKEIADLQKQLDTPRDVDYYFSNFGRTKNFVNAIDIMEIGSEVFLWEHFDTQIFLDMYLWEWGEPFFGPTLVGYDVAFDFTVHTDNETFNYVIEVTHNAGANPMARAFKNGVQVTQDDPRLFDMSLTPVTFSYRFTPTSAVNVTEMYLNSLTFFHIPPVQQGGGA